MNIKKVFELPVLRLAPVWFLVLVLVFAMWPESFTAKDQVDVYLDMAAGKKVTTPFAYRVLVPGIVGLLPLPPMQGYFVVTFLATFGTLGFLYRLFREVGISHGSSVITVVLAGFSYPLAFYLGRWWRIDPMANLLFVIAFLLIVRKKLYLASVIIAVGVLAKETMMILVPILFVSALRPNGEKILNKWLRAGLFCIPSVLILLSLRMAIPPSEGIFNIQGPMDYLELLQMIWTYNVDNLGFLARISRELLRSFGFFWSMALLGISMRNSAGKEATLYSLYLIAAGFALCLIASDWSRMLGTAFPGVFILVSCFVEGMKRSHAPKWMLWAIVILGMVQSPLSLMEYRAIGETGRVALAASTVVVFLFGTACSVWGYIWVQSHTEKGNLIFDKVDHVQDR